MWNVEVEWLIVVIRCVFRIVPIFEKIKKLFLLNLRFLENEEGCNAEKLYRRVISSWLMFPYGVDTRMNPENTVYFQSLQFFSYYKLW